MEEGRGQAEEGRGHELGCLPGEGREFAWAVTVAEM